MEATTLSHPDRNTFHHDQAAQIGVLLVNLGTPDAPTRAAVRRYLKGFLWDPRVVEMARPLWWLVLNGVILNTRPARSAKAYQKIWTDEGSPLLTISRRQRDALADVVAQRFGCGVPMALGMRYGSPSIRSALAELRDAGARRILVLPLYPQYSATTTASIFDAVTAELRGWRWLPELRFINHYHDEAAYIGALTDSVRRHRAESGDAERLLMVGTGALAPHLILAHAAVRPLRNVLIWGRNYDKARRLAARLDRGRLRVAATEDLEGAARGADVISCATMSNEPIIQGDWLEPGTHLDLVGAYKPTMRECDDEAVLRSRLFVDTREGALTEGGDLAQPLAAGLITADDIAGDLFDLTRGDRAGRRYYDQITLFKSVGTAIEDLAAAQLTVQQA